MIEKLVRQKWRTINLFLGQILIKSGVPLEKLCWYSKVAYQNWRTRARNLDFQNSQTLNAALFKFQALAAILKISRGLGSRGRRGWGVAPMVSKPLLLKSLTSN